MNDFLQRLKQRKIVQWAIAYVAFAFALIQVLDVVVQRFRWPGAIERYVILALVVGFCVLLLLAWYHGERDAQRVGSMEIMLLALLLAIGGGLIWHFGAAPASARGQVVTTPHVSVRSAASASAPRTPAVFPAARQPIPAKSVAVLPFENLSTDKANAYFADGMQDLILTKLADIGDLKVISRTSTMKYASHPDDLKTIGQQLGVATILEGSVQKAGKQVLINVQLIDVKTDSHIWAESYTRTLTNIFGVEGEVAQKVAAALDAKLSASESRAVATIPTTNPKAYTLFLKAQYDRDQFDNGDAQPIHLQLAKHYLKQAIAQDPKYAAAYAGLSLLYDEMRGFAVEDPDASIQNIVTLARKALALQPNLATGHIALGAGLSRKLEFGQALQEWETAARLAPNDADVAIRLGQFHLEVRDWRQAAIDFDKALRLDPRSGRTYENVARVEGAMRHYGAARQTLERGLAISPNDQLLHVYMARLLMLLGNPAGARAQLSTLPQDARGRPGGMMDAWMQSRNYAEALEFAEQIPNRNIWVDAGHPQLAVGRVALAMGDTSRAHATLDQARGKVLAALKQHPEQPEPLYQTLALIEMWSGNREAALQAIDKAITTASQRTKLWSASSASGVARYPSLYETRAEVLAHFGDAAGATALLVKLFEAQGTGWLISPALLRLEPVWDPIRNDPRFQALPKKYGKTSPANASTAAPAASAVSTFGGAAS